MLGRLKTSPVPVVVWGCGNARHQTRGQIRRSGDESHARTQRVHVVGDPRSPGSSAATGGGRPNDLGTPQRTRPSNLEVKSRWSSAISISVRADHLQMTCPSVMLLLAIRSVARPVEPASISRKYRAARHSIPDQSGRQPRQSAAHAILTSDPRSAGSSCDSRSADRRPRRPAHRRA